MLRLFGLFFFAVLFVRRARATSEGQWRRRIMQHIESRRDWFSVPQVVASTRAPNDLVVSVILSLTKGGVLKCQPARTIQVVRIEGGRAYIAPMFELSADPMTRLEAKELVSLQPTLPHLERLVFCVDSDDSIGGRYAARPHQEDRKRPV